MSIQNVNYSFHPIALSTTGKAWADTKNSLSTRICTAAANVAYDIYVKNPYDLTIGNCKKLKNTKEPPSIFTKVSVCTTAVFGSLYTLMLYGTTLHLLGASLGALGSKAGFSILPKVAQAVQILGKHLFLSGAVPIYGTFYALPKQIIIAIPLLANKIIIKIAIAANWTFQNVMTPLWTKVIYPTAQLIEMGLTFIATKMNIAFKAISQIVVNIANVLFKYMLTPLWKNALYPALKTMEKAAHFVITRLNSTLQAIEDKVVKILQLIFQNVLSPLWNQTILPCLKMLGKATSYLAKEFRHILSVVASMVEKSVQFIFTNIIIPAWNKLVFPVLKFTTNIINQVVIIISQTANTLVQATAKTAFIIFEKAIIPTFNELSQLILNAGSFLSNDVVKPLEILLADVARKVEAIFKVVTTLCLTTYGKKDNLCQH